MILGITGSRPQKIGGYKIPNPTYIKVYQHIEHALKELRPDKIITGLALGVDQISAVIAHRLHIPFVGAIPFKGQESKWPEKSQSTYKKLVNLASENVIVSEGNYSAHKLQIRNEYIVKNSDLMLAIFDGSTGGTYNCVNYAKSVNKNLITINTLKFDIDDLNNQISNWNNGHRKR